MGEAARVTAQKKRIWTYSMYSCLSSISTYYHPCYSGGWKNRQSSSTKSSSKTWRN